MYMPSMSSTAQPTATSDIHRSFPFVRCLLRKDETSLAGYPAKQPQANYFGSFYSSCSPSLSHSFLMIHANYNEREMERLKHCERNEILFSRVIQPWKLSSLFRGKLLLMTFLTDPVHRNYYSAAPPGMNIHRRSCRLHCLYDALINWFLGIEAGNILAATMLFISPAWQIELLSELLFNILLKSIEIDDGIIRESCSRCKISSKLNFIRWKFSKNQ